MQEDSGWSRLFGARMHGRLPITISSAVNTSEGHTISADTSLDPLFTCSLFTVEDLAAFSHISRTKQQNLCAVEAAWRRKLASDVRLGFEIYCKFRSRCHWHGGMQMKRRVRARSKSQELGPREGRRKHNQQDCQTQRGTSRDTASKSVHGLREGAFLRRVKSEVFTMNMCERLFEEMHADCPGWMKYDPELMESAKVTQKDTVFCICPCRKRPLGQICRKR